MRSRSGHGFNADVRLANCVGVIDSDYRGEVRVVLVNHGGNEFEVKPGDRVAQLLVQPVERAVFTRVESLAGSERGENGFGSTGR